MRSMMLATACATALVLSACGNKDAATEPAATEMPTVAETPTATDAATPVPADGATGDVLLDKEGKPVALVPFDPASVPVSTQPLGSELPFFSMPTGYGPVNRVEQRAYARFPFRLGEGLHWVEGPSWSTRIGIDNDVAPDKEYSALELRRNLEAVLEQAGAKKVFEGPLKRDVYYGTLVR